jgi:hypothetical protein
VLMRQEDVECDKFEPNLFKKNLCVPGEGICWWLAACCLSRWPMTSHSHHLV